MSSEKTETDPLHELAAQFRDARFREGGQEALERLYRRLAPGLLAFLRARCRGQIQADDLAQQTWLKAWRSRKQFQDGHFKGWLFTIARNLLKDAYRKKRETALPPDFEVGLDIQHSDTDGLAALKDCLGEVDGVFVSVVRDHLQGMKTEEIAARHNIQRATVYTRFDRGKKLLRECVDRKLQ